MSGIVEESGGIRGDLELVRRDLERVIDKIAGELPPPPPPVAQGPFCRLEAAELSALAGSLANCFIGEPSGDVKGKPFDLIFQQVLYFHPGLARYKDEVEFRNFVFELARGMGAYFHYQVTG